MQASDEFQRNRVLENDCAEGATWGRVLVAVAFFTYSYVFIWRYVDTQLLYHGDMLVLGPEWRITFPWFQMGWSFLSEHLRQPGGVADYLATLLAQYFFYPMAGALVFTLLGAAIFSGTILLGRALQTQSRWAVAYLSPLTVLGIASAYAFPLVGLVGVIIALYAVGVYFLVASQRVGVIARSATFTVLCLLVFWAASGNGFLLAIGCGLIEWRSEKRTGLGWAFLAIGCGVVLTGTYLDLVNRADEGFHFIWQQLWTQSYRSAIPTLVYGGQIAAMLLWSWRMSRRARRAEQLESASRTVRDQWFSDAVGVALLAGIALLTSFGILDTEARPLLRANYLARVGQWSEMLEEIKNHPPLAYPPCLLYDINRALYETDQLPDRMFSFPQDPQYLIQFGKDAVPYRGCQDLLMAMGCVNEAEHTACEALEVRGFLPYVLRDLVLINIVKDRPEAARVFLNLLSRDVIHRPWALDYLRRLDKTPRLESDKEVAQLRRSMVRNDRISLSSYELFDLLLEQNANNRMAFEYRMAHWLLTCQLEKVAEQLPAMQKLGYDRIPKNYAEALLMYSQTSGELPELGDWSIDAETRSRFEAFVQLTRSQNRDAAMLARLAAGTYYEYFFAHNVRTP